jgi:hypothetical protein
VFAYLFVAVVVIAADGGFLDGTVHALDLAVGPGRVGLGEPVLDSMAKTGAIEGVTAEHGRRPFTVLRQLGELDAVIGERVWIRYGTALTSASRKADAVCVSARSSSSTGVPGLKCASGEERHWTRRAYGTRQEVPT